MINSSPQPIYLRSDRPDGRDAPLCHGIRIHRVPENYRLCSRDIDLPDKAGRRESPLYSVIYHRYAAFLCLFTSLFMSVSVKVGDIRTEGHQHQHQHRPPVERVQKAGAIPLPCSMLCIHHTCPFHPIDVHLRETPHFMTLRSSQNITTST